MNRVCPDCGSEQFTQTRIMSVDVTMEYDPAAGGWCDMSEEITDGGERDGDITCDDCGLGVSGDDLVTEETYDEGVEL